MVGGAQRWPYPLGLYKSQSSELPNSWTSDESISCSLSQALLSPQGMPWTSGGRLGRMLFQALGEGPLPQVTSRRPCWQGVPDSSWVKAQLSEMDHILLGADGELEYRKLSAVGEGRVGQLTGDHGK